MKNEELKKYIGESLDKATEKGLEATPKIAETTVQKLNPPV